MFLRLTPSVFLVFAALAVAQPPDKSEYSGYLRAGTGVNTKGGDQECFYNQGASANEFRLGNECEIYAEFGKKWNHYRLGDISFDSYFRVAAVSRGHSSFEGYEKERTDSGQDNPAASSNERLYLVEAFAEAKGVLGKDIKVWAGKRFYREHQLQLYDWYYFGSASGNGAGVVAMPLGQAKLDLAVLKQTQNSLNSESGRSGVTFFDIRLRDIKMGENKQLLAWGAYGLAPGGVDGWLLGLMWRSFSSNGYRELALLRGEALLEGLSLYGDPNPSNKSEQDAKYRWRAVYHSAYELAPKMAYQTALVYESWNLGEWLSAGLGPVFFLSDYVQINTVLGTSMVNDQSPASKGRLHLTRLTLAPQVAPSRSHWARPALRVYYTQSFWNEPNQSKVGGSAPSYMYERSGGSFGVQVEHWF